MHSSLLERAAVLSRAVFLINTSRLRRVLNPLSLFTFGLLSVAFQVHAAIVDTGDISAQASAFMTLFIFIGAIAAVISVIFAGLAIRGRNIGEGVIGLLCAVAAIFVLSHAQGWVTSITGVAL